MRRGAKKNWRNFLEVSDLIRIFAAEIGKRNNMCTYHIRIDDAVMEAVRPSIASGMDENAWVQMQVEALFAQMVTETRNRPQKRMLSQRLRGIGHAPKDFDYKKELEDRF